MSALPSIAPEPDEAAPPPDTAKRRQILSGARAVFLANGFDAASMGEIARAAGVSKGTLYVYFDSKEALFRALIVESRRAAAERLTDLGSGRDIGAELSGFARRLIAELTAAEHVSLVRMVIGAAEKFPDLGRAFFEAGAAYGAARLADWLRDRHADGVLRIDDPETAAWQFLGMCNMPAMTATVMGAAPPPDPAAVARTAEAAVATFLKAFGPRA